MIQYDELKRLAEAATQGTWTHLKHGVIKGGPAVQFTNGSSQQQIVMTTGADWMKAGEQYANADFIAAANPAAVLALIAESERIESERADLWRGKRDVEGDRDTKSAVIAELKAEVAGLKTGYEAYERVNAELKAEVDKLRKERDARHPFKPFHEPSIGYTGCVICGMYTDHGGLPCPKTRATAYAALGQGEQS